MSKKKFSIEIKCEAKKEKKCSIEFYRIYNYYLRSFPRLKSGNKTINV